MYIISNLANMCKLLLSKCLISLSDGLIDRTSAVSVGHLMF